MYSASGIAKVRGDWLKDPLVLWSHVHDSYQTAISFALASVLPGWSWTALQAMVLAFEVFAPVWFGLSRTRTAAFVFGAGRPPTPPERSARRSARSRARRRGLRP